MSENDEDQAKADAEAAAAVIEAKKQSLLDAVEGFFEHAEDEVKELLQALRDAL